MFVGLFYVFIGFIITIVVEVFVSYLMGLKRRIESKVVILASVFTYPILQILINILSLAGLYTRSFGFSIIILELIVILVEAYLLHYVFQKKYSFSQLLLISFIMNAASYTVGYFIFA